MCRAWPGSASCRRPRRSRRADDRYAAVVALTGEKPDFRLAVRLRAVTPGTFELPGAEVADMYRPGGVRPPGGRAGSPSWRRSEHRRPTRINLLPLPLREGVGGRGRGGLGVAPSPQPPPARGGGGPCSPSYPVLPSLCLALAALGAALDHAFPPDLSRLASVGTEILDRQDRPLALLPAPGGVWRFRSGHMPRRCSPTC